MHALTRRSLLHLPLAAAAQSPSSIATIEHSVHFPNLDGRGQTWFHPRIARYPNGRLLMTLQGITGSDYFHPVHWSESDDAGRTWSTPRPIPNMGRHTNPDGVEEGYCDTVPEYHAPSNTIIAMAHNVYYRDGKLTRPNDQRWPVYTVRRPSGAWTPIRRLEWRHPEATAIYTSNCSQRVTLPSGDILVPLSFGPTGRPDRAAATLRCTFDGETLRAAAHGNILRCSVGRGLLEPSLAAWNGVYYMTIRAENNQGFITRSANGLEWEPMKPWTFDDGEPIQMSTTQQRWLPHSSGPWLVYTRRDPSNVNVMRWRAPLWMAQVNTRSLTLIRSTERVAIPINADGIRDAAAVEHQGNFHTTAISGEESLVSTGTVVPNRWTGAIRIARIRWSQPNQAL